MSSNQPAAMTKRCNHDRRQQMTHWSRSGISFAERGHDDSTAMLWGDPAATLIEAGVQRLIARLDTELGRYPTVAEIHEHICGGTPAPEITEGIIYAANVFRTDVGRYPTPAEVLAGLLLVDTEIALFTYIANEIRVGDRVMWAEHDDNGQLLHQARDGSEDTLVFAYGTVTAQPEGWNGPHTIASDDGRTLVVRREWLVKVPNVK
jgi:hypothetical protein